MISRMAVMGAGAVGCYYGGMLARAGHSVVLIGRASHVAAIQQDGLRLEAKGFDERIRIDASTEPSAVAGAGLVLFCVKSTDTEAAAEAMRPWLAPDAIILTLQNGVDNAERVRRVLPQTVAATVVYVATEMRGPGHVKHHGRGELLLEPTAASEAVARCMTDAGIAIELSGDVRGALWTKLILNSAYNALSAITRLPYGQLALGPGVDEVLRDVVAECVAVAHADGVPLPPGLDRAVAGIVQTMPTQFSSTAQDLARGKPTEIDHLNGFILRRGAALGVATPVNRVLHTLVKLLESRNAPSRSRDGIAITGGEQRG